MKKIKMSNCNFEKLVTLKSKKKKFWVKLFSFYI